jgi:hypothetical protein
MVDESNQSKSVFWDKGYGIAKATRKPKPITVDYASKNGNTPTSVQNPESI